MDFRGLVSKRVRKITLFGLKSGQDLENRAAHPHQEVPFSSHFTVTRLSVSRTPHYKDGQSGTVPKVSVLERVAFILCVCVFGSRVIVMGVKIINI